MYTSLLVIDPQNDFCSPKGQLYIPGAEEDCRRLISFIEKSKTIIDSIYLTLDTHPYYHIAHPIFWKNSEGMHPDPYTIITAQDFRDGLWIPVDSQIIPYAEEYLLSLEAKGRYRLTIWPPHCLIATWGHCISEELWQGLHTWEMEIPGRNVEYHTKASNFRTEHYSAIQAEVPDHADASTRINFALIDKLKYSDRILIAGEALSHCVANTVRDLSIYISASKMVLITDTMSNVTGFEKAGSTFIADLTAKGMVLGSTQNLSL